MNIKNLALLYGGSIQREKDNCNNIARINLSQIIISLRSGLFVVEIDNVIDKINNIKSNPQKYYTQNNLLEIMNENFLILDRATYIERISSKINKTFINSFNIVNSDETITRFINLLADFVYNIKPNIQRILTQIQSSLQENATLNLNQDELDNLKAISIIRPGDFLTSINQINEIIKQIKTNHSRCPLCPFNNSADNKNKNKCQEFDTSVSNCFGPNRLNEELYIQGLSNFVLENNITVTAPEGEVCFGNTITSCVTFCLIFQNNKKLSVHVNPATNLAVYATFMDDTDSIRESEEVTIYNVFDKFLEIIALNNLSDNLANRIKKIIILAETDVQLYSDRTDNYLKTISNIDIIVPTESIEYYSKNYQLETSDKHRMKQFIKRKLFPFVMEDAVIQFKIKTVSTGSIYFVKSDGLGVYINSNGTNIENF